MGPAGTPDVAQGRREERRCARRSWIGATRPCGTVRPGTWHGSCRYAARFAPACGAIHPGTRRGSPRYAAHFDVATGGMLLVAPSHARRNVSRAVEWGPPARRTWPKADAKSAAALADHGSALPGHVARFVPVRGTVHAGTRHGSPRYAAHFDADTGGMLLVAPSHARRNVPAPLNGARRHAGRGRGRREERRCARRSWIGATRPRGAIRPGTRHGSSRPRGTVHPGTWHGSTPPRAACSW